jgi:hypothetical protein
VLPLVLAALVLRALIPAGFMSGGPGSSLVVSMCAPSAGTETIEIPGAPPELSTHCDFCFAPVLGAAPAFAASVAPAINMATPLPGAQAADTRHRLVRAQSSRGPPPV